MKLGARGERAAARFLKRLGYRILIRNYVCPAGEIDIVALDGDTIVFVEVKTRKSTSAAFPEANVTYQKQKQLTRTAKMFLTIKSLQHRPCRFDVVAVVMNDREKPVIEHFIDAFAPVGC